MEFAHFVSQFPPYQYFQLIMQFKKLAHCLHMGTSLSDPMVLYYNLSCVSIRPATW